MKILVVLLALLALTPTLGLTQVFPFQTIEELEQAPGSKYEGRCSSGPTLNYAVEKNGQSYVVFTGRGGRFTAATVVNKEPDTLYFGIMEKGQFIVSKTEKFNPGVHRSPCDDWLN
jgi:hypothetical protein